MFIYYPVKNDEELEYALNVLMNARKTWPETVLHLYFFTSSEIENLKGKARDHANAHGYTIDVMEREYDPEKYPEDALIFGGPMEALRSNVNNLE